MADGNLVALADALLLRREELVTMQLEALSAFPHYREVPDEELRLSCDRNVVRAALILRGQDELPPEVVEDERRSGVKRAQQGIPAEVVLEAYRKVIGVIRDAYLAEAATRPEIDLADTLLGTRRLWELTDHFSSALVSSRHEVDLDLARRSEQKRIDFVRGVLDGSGQPMSMDYGVVDGELYWALCGRPRVAGDHGLLHTLEKLSQNVGFASLVITVGKDVAGILPYQPEDLGLADGTVSVVGPVAPAELASAFQEATRLVDVAWRFKMSGIVTAGALGLRVAVVEQPAIGEFLYRKYVTPVLIGSSMAEEILSSLRVYLGASRSVRSAAQQLHIHVNTLRYRIEKFEELTECDLTQTTVLAEIWWALQYASLKES